GQLYLGAIPLLLLVIGASRGVLWDREIRFFTVAAVTMLLYALGWYTPVFQAAYVAAPGVDLYRRPADALFLVGGLGAVMAGYVAHRLFGGTLPQAGRWRRRALEAGAVVLPFALALVFAVRLDRL